MVAHDIPKLESQARERTGTRYAQRVRKQGRLPAVIYGHGQEPVHITLDAKAFNELLHHEAHLIDVTVGGKSDHCLVKDVQWDYLGREIIHADLTRVDLGEEVEVEVELQLVGEAVGLKEAGAILDQHANTIAIKCRADSIPDHLEHDISGLAVGGSVTVGDLTPPAGVVIAADAETLVAAISFAKAVEEEEVAAESTSDEPEVIEKGKGDDENDG